jgi:hypothetical protein
MAIAQAAHHGNCVLLERLHVLWTSQGLHAPTGLVKWLATQNNENILKFYWPTKNRAPNERGIIKARAGNAFPLR